MIVGILAAVTLLAGQDASSAPADPAFPKFGVIDTRGWSEGDAVKSLQDLFAELEVDASWVLTDPDLSDETKTRRLRTSLGLWRPEIDRRAETLGSILRKNEIGRGLSPDQARAVADERVEALVSASFEALHAGYADTSDAPSQIASPDPRPTANALLRDLDIGGEEIRQIIEALRPAAIAIRQDPRLSPEVRAAKILALFDPYEARLEQFKIAITAAIKADILADGRTGPDVDADAPGWGKSVVAAMMDALLGSDAVETEGWAADADDKDRSGPSEYDLPREEKRLREASAALAMIFDDMETQATAICEERDVPREARRNRVLALLDPHRAALTEFEAALESHVRASLLAGGDSQEEAERSARSYRVFVIDQMANNLLISCREGSVPEPGDKPSSEIGEITPDERSGLGGQSEGARLEAAQVAMERVLASIEPAARVIRVDTGLSSAVRAERIKALLDPYQSEIVALQQAIVAFVTTQTLASGDSRQKADDDAENLRKGVINDMIDQLIDGE